MEKSNYTTFMEKYSLDHKCCPKCSTELHSTTLAGYIFNAEKPEEYKDRNRCKCLNCGDVHITHERIPKNE